MEAWHGGVPAGSGLEAAGPRGRRAVAVVTCRRRAAARAGAGAAR